MMAQVVTIKILDVLDDYNIRASFFVGEKR
jgi:peptidoglycan/xylan/chitin deacetylase (PgdA/CDA1 family)